jgi:hypothetical protein
LPPKSGRSSTSSYGMPKHSCTRGRETLRVELAFREAGDPLEPNRRRTLSEGRTLNSECIDPSIQADCYSRP